MLHPFFGRSFSLISGSRIFDDRLGIDYGITCKGNKKHEAKTADKRLFKNKRPPYDG